MISACVVGSVTYCDEDESSVVGFSRWLIRLTIQLNNRPYRALAMASLTPTVSSTLFCRMIVSPRAIIPDVVNASVNWSVSTPSRLDTTATTASNQITFNEHDVANVHACSEEAMQCNIDTTQKHTQRIKND